MSYGGKVVILPGQAEAEEFSTLVHEAAHELIHKSNRRTATTTTVRETEAEAIAFVIGTTVGLDNGRSSASYIQLYHGDAAFVFEYKSGYTHQFGLPFFATREPVTAPAAGRTLPDFLPQ